MSHSFLLHTSSYLQWTASPIRCLARHPHRSILAIGRANGIVEIWPSNIDNATKPFFALNSREGTSTWSMTWRGDVLVVGGLQGEITLWDVPRRTPLQIYDTISPVWNLCYNSQQDTLAAACEDGSVRVFIFEDDTIQDNDEHHNNNSMNNNNNHNYKSIHHGQLVLTDTIQVQPNIRTTSVAYSQDGATLVTGNAGGQIKAYQASRNGYKVTHQSLWVVDLAEEEGVAGDERRKRERNRRHHEALSSSSSCIIWTLLMLKDDTIVSGDSLGRTCFLDGMIGVVDSLFDNTHNGVDVLCLAVAPDDHAIVAAGVGGRMVQYIQNERQHWIAQQHHYFQYHDIYAVDFVFQDGVRKVLCAGDSANITVNFTRFWPLPIINGRQSLSASFSPSSSLSVDHNHNHIHDHKHHHHDNIDSILALHALESQLQLWRFTDREDTEPSFLFSVDLSPGEWYFSAACLMEDGRHLVYATQTRTVVLSLMIDGDRVHASETEMAMDGDKTEGCSIIRTPGKHNAEGHVLLIGMDNTIYWGGSGAKGKEPEIKKRMTLPPMKHHETRLNPSIRETIIDAALSPQSKWAAVGTSSQRVVIFNIDTGAVHTEFSMEHPVLRMHFMSKTVLVVNSHEHVATVRVPSKKKTPETPLRCGVDNVYPITQNVLCLMNRQYGLRTFNLQNKRKQSLEGIMPVICMAQVPNSQRFVGVNSSFASLNDALPQVHARKVFGMD
eukprot:gb/GECH01000812.1/.p1 GENE.gb/GECH01000812.1/~~gb/GECH01000812.1/.p1  ORF type:complete len:723 (+),score=100.35 gb/GECH01000812.1/:1-2169(+)